MKDELVMMKRNMMWIVQMVENLVMAGQKKLACCKEEK